MAELYNYVIAFNQYLMKKILIYYVLRIQPWYLNIVDPLFHDHARELSLNTWLNETHQPILLTVD